MIDYPTLFSQVVFVVLGVLAFAKWLHHRDAPRFDIALLFGTFALSVAVTWIQDAFGLEGAWIALVGGVVIMIHPYIFLRVVGHLIRIPPPILRVTFIGLVLSVAALVLLPAPRPGPVTGFLIAYFVIVETYAVVLLVRGASTRGGETKRRLAFAAWGAGALALFIFLIGVQVAVPATAPVVQPTYSFIIVAMAASFYIAFAPPRALRRYWMQGALHGFLQQLSEGGPTAGRSADLIETLVAKATETTGSSDGYFVMDVPGGTPVLYRADHEPSPAPGAFQGDDIVAEVWTRQTPVIERIATTPASQIPRMAIPRLNIAIPVTAPDRRFGVLMITHDYELLFERDDVEFLQLMSKQAAIMLRNVAYGDELSARVADLKRSNNELEQFAYIASHDLQEPLRMVTSYVQLIERRYKDVIDDDGREYIGFAVQGAKRMQALIQDLLLYSRVGTQRNALVPVDTGSVVESVLDDLSISVKETGTKLDVGPLPVVEGDPGQLSQLFQNLVRNAIKFRSAEAPMIRISAAREGDEWHFVVADNGIGIDVRHQERIFIIFQRLHGTEEYPGTGIGLAVCKRIVERHGGRIWVDSTPGKGSAFHFTIRSNDTGALP